MRSRTQWAVEARPFELFRIRRLNGKSFEGSVQTEQLLIQVWISATELQLPMSLVTFFVELFIAQQEISAPGSLCNNI